jgi:hypothetical protein
LLASASPDRLSEIAKLVDEYEPIIREQIAAYDLVSGRWTKGGERLLKGYFDENYEQKLQKEVDQALERSNNFLQKLRTFNGSASAPESTDPLEASDQIVRELAFGRVFNSLKELLQKNTPDLVLLDTPDEYFDTACVYNNEVLNQPTSRFTRDHHYQNSLLQKLADLNLYLAEASLNAARPTDNSNQTQTGAELAYTEEQKR